jgi:phospholipase C
VQCSAAPVSSRRPPAHHTAAVTAKIVQSQKETQQTSLEQNSLFLFKSFHKAQKQSNQASAHSVMHNSAKEYAFYMPPATRRIHQEISKHYPKNFTNIF